MKKLIFLLITAYCLLLSGCKPTELIRYIPVTNTLQIHDTTTVKDVHNHFIYTKGDTVYNERTDTFFRYKILSTVRRDSVPYMVKVLVPGKSEIKEVETKGFIWYSGLFFYIALIIFTIYKLKQKLTL
jgi:hypothetical protein